ncbi:hypothetical protein [Enterobacter cloacae]|uniref:hypothetical protein n=1 Tax=Enterobacter cloacae TaxID=550 RepID=UPI0028771498|nr:hypothetical protein [Enterobacter cloacae]MDS0065458.1 hypothetical protein [Enterobacter cloacae subsp. cloacae]MDS0108152.1 hypothetical protein [Enterobacter cloacae subsp. cloacae]
MKPQAFTHENEVLAMAPLGEEDGSLFSTQIVRLTGNGEIQWDFILSDGKDWHFRQQLLHLSDDARLGAFKDYIRRVLKCQSQETMLVMIDGKEVTVPFHYETETGGRVIKVPELVGEFLDASCLGDAVPSFISARR